MSVGCLDRVFVIVEGVYLHKCNVKVIHSHEKTLVSQHNGWSINYGKGNIWYNIHNIHYTCTQTLFGESLIKVLRLTILNWSCGHFIFFLGLFSTFFSHHGGLGFWGWGFTLMEFWACSVRPSGVLWLGLFILTYKNDPGKKLCIVDSGTMLSPPLEKD